MATTNEEEEKIQKSMKEHEERLKNAEPRYLEGKKQFQPDHIIKDAHIACIVCMIQLHSGELCTGGEEGLIKLWSIKDNFQFVAELTGHRTKINDIIETFDEKLISCSDDRSIKIWIP